MLRPDAHAMMYSTSAIYMRRLLTGMFNLSELGEGELNG